MFPKNILLFSIYDSKAQKINLQEDTPAQNYGEMKGKLVNFWKVGNLQQRLRSHPEVFCKKLF